MTRCCVQVGNSWHITQCSRVGKLEHKGQLYCKQHYPPNVSERNKKRDDESQAKWRAEQLRWHSNKWSPKFLITLEEIASGELSDPVEHARAVLKEFHESKSKRTP